MIDYKAKNGKHSDKKMEVENGMRTLESLRGRLLAERQASKVANQETELMGKKLVELENQLKEETKLRNKAEKKLKFLRKKLESLKVSHTLEDSEQSSSCISNSGSKEPEKSQLLDHDNKKNASFDQEPICLDLKDVSSQNSNDISSTTHEAESTLSSSTNSMDPKSKEKIDTCNDDDDNLKNYELVLVPLRHSGQTNKNTTSETLVVDENGSEALVTLRQARERIQLQGSLMETRRRRGGEDIIRYNPSKIHTF